MIPPSKTVDLRAYVNDITKIVSLKGNPPGNYYD